MSRPRPSLSPIHLLHILGACNTQGYRTTHQSREAPKQKKCVPVPAASSSILPSSTTLLLLFIATFLALASAQCGHHACIACRPHLNNNTFFLRSTVLEQTEHRRGSGQTVTLGSSPPSPPVIPLQHNIFAVQVLLPPPDTARRTGTSSRQLHTGQPRCPQKAPVAPLPPQLASIHLLPTPHPSLARRPRRSHIPTDKTPPPYCHVAHVAEYHQLYHADAPPPARGPPPHCRETAHLERALLRWCWQRALTEECPSTARTPASPWCCTHGHTRAPTVTHTHTHTQTDTDTDT